jgi:predicted glycogen debranching enzyme
VIAGYHWFGDWGRDAMIALPGLTLVTGRFEQARAILRFFGSQVHRGLVPNFVEGTGQAAYNSADASLWFINAVWQYVRYTGDWSLVDELAGGLREIAAAYRFGTDYGIVVDDDGLVRCGQGEDQVTWMDAKVDGRAMTPRHGKPVEISALWYNAMRCLDQFATHRRWPQPTYRAAADRCRESFRSAFWNAEEGCLFDVLGERPDASIRPNQLLAVSLPFPALEGEEARSVVGRVERDLLTPFGLRTLAPTDPRYRGVYAGDQYQRDAAYHQGTVWAWLIGPFVTAWVRVRGGTPAARREAAGFLGGFDEHLATAGLGSISEIFDGDSPHAPKGCISQAWSVGEVLRCYNEDVLGREPTGDRGDTA